MFKQKNWITILTLIFISLILNGCLSSQSAIIQMKSNYSGKEIIAVQNFQKGSEDDYYQLVTVNIKSGEISPIYTGKVRELVTDFIPSPINDSVLFLNDTNLCLFDYKHKKYIKKIPVGKGIWSIGWCPGGKAFFYTSYKNGFQVENLSTQNIEMNYDGILGFDYSCLCWSRDGNKALMINKPKNELFIYNLKEKTKKILKYEDLTDVHFFDSDRKLVYLRDYGAKSSLVTRDLSIDQTQEISSYNIVLSPGEDHFCLMNDNAVIFHLSADETSKVYYVYLLQKKITVLKLPSFYWNLWDYNTNTGKIILQQNCEEPKYIIKDLKDTL